MRRLTLGLLALLLFITVTSNTYAIENNSKLIEAMQSDGHILMLRHAMAPGFGDPENIKIGDCSTQRNLDGTGRTQSKQIGAWLKHNNIKPSAIYSSQWCRCLETAKLMDVGNVKELPALNSFFEMTENREPNLKKLNAFIAAQNTTNKLIIMVTHSVTISAIAGHSVASGDGVLLKLNKDKYFDVISVVKPELIKD